VVHSAPPIPGRYVYLEVIDRAAAWMRRLGQDFRPVFNTKFAGRGLGLAACSALSAVTGATKVDSEPAGHHLPGLFPASTKDAVPSVRWESTPWRGKGTILSSTTKSRSAMCPAECWNGAFCVLRSRRRLEAIELFRPTRRDVCVLLDWRCRDGR